MSQQPPDTLRFGAGYPGCLLIGGALALVMVGGGLYAIPTGAAPLAVAAPQLVFGLGLAYLCAWRRSLSIELGGRTVRRSGPPFLQRTRAFETERIAAVHRRHKSTRSEGGVRSGVTNVRLVLDDGDTIVVPGVLGYEDATELARRLRVPFEEWSDDRRKERRDSTGQLEMDPG